VIGGVAVMIVVAGIGIALLVQMVGRHAALGRHRCPPERPWAERELRLRHALQGHGQWIDTEEVGLPADAVHRVCASVGWRVRAAFRIDRYAWMLWTVGPTPPPLTVEPRPDSRRRRLARFLRRSIVGVAVLVGVRFVIYDGDDLPVVPTLAVAVALGIAVVVVVVRNDPLRQPRRLLRADLAARFHGDRVRIVVGPLDRRHQQLVPLLAESLGYQPAWGGSRHVQVYRRERPEGVRSPCRRGAGSSDWQAPPDDGWRRSWRGTCRPSVSSWSAG
jgi:hypothetical protein